MLGKQIENVCGNRQLWKKAYLVEFYTNDREEPEAVFTFSIPPESEEITYTQRKTETKTFGGLHVDQYGTDAARITLSGSTVNQSVKRIYGNNKKDKWLSGEDEVYYFRDLILHYQSLEFLNANKKAKILIYDLSKFAGSDAKHSDPITNPACWEAYPGDFKIRRSSDRPFTYKYTFEFTCVQIKAGKEKNVLPSGSGEIAFIRATANAIKSAMDWASGVQTWTENILDCSDQVLSLLNLLEQTAAYSSDILESMIGRIGETGVRSIAGAESVAQGARDILYIPRDITILALNIGKDVYEATERMAESWKALGKRMKENYLNTPADLLEFYGFSRKEYEDVLTKQWYAGENAANALVVLAKSAAVPEMIAGFKNPQTGKTEIITVYGSTEVRICDTDTFETLAYKYLGSPDRAIDIAAYNGIASRAEAQPGDAIRIPITTLTESLANNRVFALQKDRDIYGRDIALTSLGNIVTEKKDKKIDYAIVRGTANLSQAVLLRLRESKSKRIRHTAYGIRKNIGEASAGAAYIVSSVKMTLLADPRVASVDGIQFTANRDSLEISVTYTDANTVCGNVAGRV